MLELNTDIKELKKFLLLLIKMIKVLYSKKMAILIFLLKCSNAEELMAKNQNKFIKTAKSIDIIIVKIKDVIK